MSRMTVQSLMKQALGVAMEDAENNAEVVINVAVNSEPTPEEEEIEVNEVGEEAEESTEVVDELDEAAATLESIAVSLEAHIQEGGIDATAATYLNLALAGVAGRIGLKSNTPSLESFGGSSDRLAATQVSLEEVKESIKKVAQAVKNAIIRAVQGMLAFFARVFGGMKKIEARATELKKAVAGAKGKKADGKVKLMGTSRLSLGKKFDGSTAANAIANLERAGKGLYETFGKKITDAIAEAAEGKEPKLNNLAEGLFNGEIAGGYSIDSTKAGSYEVPTIKSDDGRTDEESAEFEPLSTDAMDKILDEVLVVCKMVVANEKAAKDLGKEITDAAKGLKDDGKVKPADFSKVANASVKVFNQFNSLAFKVTRAGLTAVERSVAAYK